MQEPIKIDEQSMLEENVISLKSPNKLKNTQIMRNGLVSDLMFYEHSSDITQKVACFDRLVCKNKDFGAIYKNSNTHVSHAVIEACGFIFSKDNTCVKRLSVELVQDILKVEPNVTCFDNILLTRITALFVRKKKY